MTRESGKCFFQGQENVNSSRWEWNIEVKNKQTYKKTKKQKKQGKCRRNNTE